MGCAHLVEASSMAMTSSVAEKQLFLTKGVFIDYVPGLIIELVCLLSTLAEFSAPFIYVCFVLKLNFTFMTIVVDVYFLFELGNWFKVSLNSTRTEKDLELALPSGPRFVRVNPLA